jgi:hypothetical protein
MGKLTQWEKGNSKGGNFTRNPRDFYPTPLSAAEPLFNHLPLEGFTFAEPCAGDRALINHFESIGGYCVWASDIEPQREGIKTLDFNDLTSEDIAAADYIITNPPWDRKILHPMIEHFSQMKPTWLLFDADWMHTKQSAPYISYLSRMVSVGRVKWFGNMSGKDNCVWYLFDKSYEQPTIFLGRK